MDGLMQSGAQVDSGSIKASSQSLPRRLFVTVLGSEPMARNPILEDVLGPLGAAIVREIAARGEASVAEVRECLRRTHRRDHAYTTVMTVMFRLHERGVLLRERRGRQYLYRLPDGEADVIDRLSALAVDRLIDRYGTAALRHFALRLADLDSATRRRLEMLAEEE
jgi:predicted transcriptional regulator